MDNTSALLPTSPLAVEDWLRSLANPSELLKMREAGQSEYPYLFGMATVKLADAHREYLRLLDRQADKPNRIDAVATATKRRRIMESGR